MIAVADTPSVPTIDAAATGTASARGSSIAADATRNHCAGAQSQVNHHNGTYTASARTAKLSTHALGRSPRVAARLCRS